MPRQISRWRLRVDHSLISYRCVRLPKGRRDRWTRSPHANRVPQVSFDWSLLEWSGFLICWRSLPEPFKMRFEPRSKAIEQLIHHHQDWCSFIPSSLFTSHPAEGLMWMPSNNRCINYSSFWNRWHAALNEKRLCQLNHIKGMVMCMSRSMDFHNIFQLKRTSFEWPSDPAWLHRTSFIYTLNGSSSCSESDQGHIEGGIRTWVRHTEIRDGVPEMMDAVILIHRCMHISSEHVFSIELFLFCKVPELIICRRVAVERWIR